MSDILSSVSPMEDNEPELMEEEQQDFVRRMELYEDDDEAPCIRCCDCDLSCPCGWCY